MICIFCLKDRTPSQEHVFPSAIGGKLEINRVCLPCNNWLGSNVDALLTDHDLIMLTRANLGMRDSKGNVINPWTKVFQTGNLANDPEQKVKLVPDAESGQLVPQLIYKKLISQASDNGDYSIQITIDSRQKDEIGKIIQRERKRNCMPPLSSDEIQTQVETAKKSTKYVDKPEVVFSLQVDTMNYFRAICKIAYELAWLWLGDKYLDDPVAALLREVVLKDSKHTIKGKVEIGIVEPLNLWNREPNAHIGFSKPSGNSITISIRIFDAISAIVVVSESKDKYPNYCDSSQSGGFILNDPLTGASRHSSLTEELLRMTTHTR